eukprot:snap_masked-scaffold133_size323035-processed-gene-1.2 protein:Tk02234 transcript:snap_masked-scaffold133_size323035-processed-gene-1.2-mRNA-1 annotation:"hypothetical protein D910_11801"
MGAVYRAADLSTGFKVKKFITKDAVVFPIMRINGGWRTAVGSALTLILGWGVLSAHGVAVMSVDLGSEWMKVAVVSPGVPMEIALNKESKRKTAVAVAMRNGERVFGSDALSLGVRHPKNCYFYLLDLLGKTVDHPQVKLFHERFPYYDIKPHPDRGTVMFQHDEDTVYTIEELVAMILENAKATGEMYTEQKIKDAVLAIPVFFNQAERRALMEAASLANLQVLQLITEPMSVALNYGMFRRKEINGTARNLMFYDMGAQHTTVSIASFQVIKTKERGFSETHPQAQVLGVGYNRNLGGKSLQIKLRDHLADKFNELKKTKTNVWTVPRAIAKISKEAERNLNTDEASAMGAVYRAADLSTGFKVKKFITKDAVVFPIDVDFERLYENDDGETGVKQVKRSLFAKMNPYPQKKIMTFNKQIGDFKFNVNLNDLDHLGEGEIAKIGSLNLTQVTVKGLAEALEKHVGEANVESKGVKAHFALDDSGLLSVSSVEAVFEKTISVEEQEAQETKEEAEKPAKEAGEGLKGDDKDSWANLGDTISNFFNKDGDKSEGDDAKDTDGKKDKKAKKDDKKKEAEKKIVPKKPKIETTKEPLEFEVQILDLTPISPKLAEESISKLKALNDFDDAKKARETALNSLETFVIDVRDKLYQDVWETSATEEEREKFNTKCSEVSDWIDEEVTPDTELEPLEAKLKEIKDLTASWFARVREHLDRPEALGALNQMLNTSSNFLGKAKGKTGEDGLFSEKELEALEKKIQTIETWKAEKGAEQEKQPLNEMPKMTTSIIAEKALDLDREVKYLINKAKIAQAEKERERRLKEAEEKKAKDEEEKKKKKEKKKKAKKSEEDKNANEQTQTGDGDIKEETPESQDATEEPTVEEVFETNEELFVEEESISDENVEVPTENDEESSHSEL